LAPRPGGILELLRDGARLVVPPNDPDALAEALRSLAGRPALRSKLRAQGRKRIVEHFCVETVAEALEKRFRQVVFGGYVPASPVSAGPARPS
jgi:glycosyltransferase involved in cell wall biosynthesis